VTEEQKKEAMSREFVKILAYAHGFKTLEPPIDHGVDMTVCPVSKFKHPSGETRYLDSQHKLDFQIKSTTKTGVTEAVDGVHFPLESKTFNDLVHRRSNLYPLHLIVVVLDESPPACVVLDSVKLSLMARAFWYLPDLTEELTPNSSTKTIVIPTKNLIGTTFVSDCYAQLGIEL
jgi:Domain of unknown function (DUF4365)